MRIDRESIVMWMIGLILIGSGGCKRLYTPPAITAPNNYLVVEGVINTGSDSSLIRLTRTVPLSSLNGSIPETGATINIISDASMSYPVFEKGNGYYISKPVNGNGQSKYALKITTKNGESYQSDFVSPINSPAIDSVYYKVKSDGVDVYLDTHDPTNTAKYYRWDYTDTYLFHTAFHSIGKFAKTPKDTVVFRPLAEQNFQCWHSDTSSSILLGSTAKLSQTVISRAPIVTIPSTSIKISNRYSINVNQYGLTTDAYNYYYLLQQNTQNIGTIFDPQPSQVPGNIHSLSNPAEVVIGYITAGRPTKYRIFIDTHNLPAWLSDNPYSGCLLDTDYYHPGRGQNSIADYIYTGIDIPVNPVAPPLSAIIGWSGSSPYCVDCTLNGTNKKPDYWTDYQ